MSFMWVTIPHKCHHKQSHNSTKRPDFTSGLFVVGWWIRKPVKKTLRWRVFRAWAHTVFALGQVREVHWRILYPTNHPPKISAFINEIQLQRKPNISLKYNITLFNYFIRLSVMIPQIYEGAQPPIFEGIGFSINKAFSNISLVILPLFALLLITM